MWKKKMALSHDKFLLYTLIMLFLVTCWCCLPVNYLLSILCNWFKLVPDWFRSVLNNTYCFIIASSPVVLSLKAFIFLIKFLNSEGVNDTYWPYNMDIWQYFGTPLAKKFRCLLPAAAVRDLTIMREFACFPMLGVRL